MNKEQELQKLISDLDVFKQKLKKIDYVHNKYTFLELMKDLNLFINSIKDYKLVDLFLHSKYYVENVDFFVAMNQYFIRAIEADESLKIMSKNTKTESLVQLMDADFIVEDYKKKGDDIKDLNLEEGQTLVMVGCGPMPETLLYFYENTPIKEIIGIDNNYEAIYIAGEIIRTLGLDNIKLKYSDGCKFDYSKADIVYIPTFVEVKKQVINQVLKTGKKDVQIIVRDIQGMNKLVFRGLPNDINPEIKEVSVRETSGNFHNTRMVKFERYNI